MRRTSHRHRETHLSDLASSSLAFCHRFMANNMAITNNNLVETKPDVIFVLGQPGAGKGTQCARIVSVSDKRCQRMLLYS